MIDNIDARLARLGLLLGFVGGYVDTAGFLALQGLFTAHVTGNFVTLGASFAHGVSGSVAKLAALPVFCLFVIGARLLGASWRAGPASGFRLLIGIEAVLLTVGTVMSGLMGPFVDGDTAAAFWTGMVLVSAMAIQNAAGRMHLSALPPSTLMTGTTTQVMLDVADLLRGIPAERRDATTARLRRMLLAVCVFAAGCAAGAGALVLLGAWCFILAPIAVLLVLLGSARSEVRALL